MLSQTMMAFSPYPFPPCLDGHLSTDGSWTTMTRCRCPIHWWWAWNRLRGSFVTWVIQEAGIQYWYYLHIYILYLHVVWKCCTEQRTQRKTRSGHCLKMSELLNKCFLGKHYRYGVQTQLPTALAALLGGGAWTYCHHPNHPSHRGKNHPPKKSWNYEDIIDITKNHCISLYHWIISWIFIWIFNHWTWFGMDLWGFHLWPSSRWKSHRRHFGCHRRRCGTTSWRRGWWSDGVWSSGVLHAWLWRQLGLHQGICR